MSFKLENFGADASNIKSILGGANYYRYFNKDNNTLTTPGYFPADLGLAVGDRITVIPSVKTNPDELYVVTSTTNRTVTVTQIDTDGAVDSVNGKTGHVVLGASDVDAVAQLSTMPTASADNEGQIVQFVGTTDANYTNGYFYKCTGAGEPVVYSWTQASVQPAPSGLPDQTGQNGKFLTTDGTNASWGNALENTATGRDSLSIFSNAAKSNDCVVIGKYAGTTKVDFSSSAVIIGNNAGSVGTNITGSIFIGLGSGALTSSQTAQASIAIGPYAHTTVSNAIQLCAYSGGATNSEANTFKVANSNGNYMIMDANGNIPADRIADTTGLTAGNYVPRLTIDAQGNKTITWVAE